MLVVLHECLGLVEVLTCEMGLESVDHLVDHRDAVFSYDDPLHFHGADLCVPVVGSDIRNLKAFLGIGLQYFLY